MGAWFLRRTRLDRRLASPRVRIHPRSRANESGAGNYQALGVEQQAALQACLEQLMRRNTYDAAARRITLDPVRAEAFQHLYEHYSDVFSRGRDEYAIQPYALSDPVKLRRMSAFFWWTVGAASTNRPGTNVTHTQNWPHEPLAGTGTDLSGVKTEMTGTILTYVQDREADGSVFIGPPGSCKSATAKATGGTGGIPTIAFDLAAMESSLVEASTERLRTALQIIDAVSQGRMLFIATCNSIASLPPELRRHFTLGTFFFDLPTADERETIWGIYLKKYDVSGQLPNDEGWTGAEIKECCRKAHHLGITLMQAARYIVPVSRSAAEQIKALRQMASGKFISTSTPGVY